MDVIATRDEVRAYLASHPAFQTDLAEQTGVPYSWLNKFINGAFPNPRLGRLQRLKAWMDEDRAARGEAT